MSVEHCPKCRIPSLRILKSAESLSSFSILPRRCNRCHGFWIRLSSVAALSESGVLEALDDDVGDSEMDKKNGLCPEGHGILSRVKASWARPFYVERCVTCERIWLDAGEWKRLKDEQLLESIEELWRPGRRKQMLEAQNERSQHVTLEQRLGPDLLERIEEMTSMLVEHEYGDIAFVHLKETFHEKRLKNHRKKKNDPAQ